IFTDHNYEKDGYRGFTGRHISEIEERWQSGGVSALKDYIKDLGIRNSTDDDVKRVRSIARDIMLRSAQLGAATFAGIVMQCERAEVPSREYAYAVDGSLLNYPGYIDMMKAALADIFGKKYAAKLEVFEAKDGAGIGAAITAMITSTQSGEKSYPAGAEKAEGLFFLPKYDFKQGSPLNNSLIKTKRGAEEVRKLLLAARDEKIELSISGHLRGVDGAGSSLDLPEFQKRLTEAGVTSPDALPSTPTIASAFSVKIRFEAADDPDVIEYIAPDYGITAQNPYRVYGPIMLNKDSKTPNGQKDAPAFIFRNIFNLKGIRIICEEAPPMALAGGMESSNMFNVALVSAASMLSGAGLSLADIFSLAVKIENDEFNGLTGGQGHLSSMLGGAYRNVWLSGVKDAAGKLTYPYAAFSVPLLKGDDLAAIEEHMALVQAGKEYKDGRALVGRTATLINWMWTDLLRDEDAIGAPLHRGKLALTAKYAQALKAKDFKTAVEMINQYVDTRDKLCLRWMNLMLDAHEGKKEVPEYAKRYESDVFDEKSPRYKDYDVIRRMLADKGGEFLRSTSLYTLDPIASLVKKARKHGITIMPLGAGGPGANLIAISSVGSKHLRDFLKHEGVAELNDAAARAVVHGDGLLRGYIPFKVGKDPIKFNGFKDLGLSEPERPAASGEKKYPAEGPAGAGAAELFETLESQVNNERAEIIEAANQVIKTMCYNEVFIAKVGAAWLSKTQATAALKGRIERAISTVESLGENFVPVEFQATVDHLKKRIDQLEADGIVASVINLARKAKRDNQKLIIGLETDWIPGYNDTGSLQHQAMNPIIQQIESIPDILRSMGLDNVVLVHANSKDIADSLIKEADKANTRLSNVVVLASKGTIESPSFDSLRSTPTEAKAFIAAIDPVELEKFFRENKDPLKHLDIKILEMLSIALDIAAGKEPPQIPIVAYYDRALRIVVLIPKAEPKDYEELNRNYYARKTALAAA
ncbi:MAG: hypothetical protein PHN63_05040, partial [Candidatus Omnitrophica bacterium]|nr:hypothetical protein [Candidatus Omnitrophota bacterium]